MYRCLSTSFNTQFFFLHQESNGEKEETAKENGGGEKDKDEEKKSDADAEEKMEGDEEKDEDKKKEEKEKEEEDEEDDSPKPRPLHKTSSIFLRNLAPTITMQEVSSNLHSAFRLSRAV